MSANNSIACADVGLIGLAVMGQNLILNMNDHGYVVCAYNRTVEKVHRFLSNEAKGTKIVGAETIQDFCQKLKTPRKIILLVKAGNAVDDFIGYLLPHLEKGDILIDGGNSHFPDTMRRTKELEEKGFLFVGCGVSGGEEGARYGPSIMPGGSKQAWPHIKDILQSISAKSDNEPCCEWVGDSGAGHYVKMVHNGIEYGDMQLICEAYQILREGLGLSNDEIGKVFEDWNKRELDSFLIEITRDILRYKENGSYVLDGIRDAAGQKGTGKWTAVSSLDMGVPVTLIGEAVFSRCLSAIKDERVEASKILTGPKSKRINLKDQQSKTEIIAKIESALYASKIISYAQGFMLLKEAAKQYNWELNYGGVALMWKGGCIIRSAFLGDIKNAYKSNPNLKNLLFDPFFKEAVTKHEQNWREIVSLGVLSGIPLPAMSSALAFYDGYRCEKLPANLLQAQRDYFGAHTYETLENPNQWVHTNWTGRGGNVSSSSYQV